jgi:hypothetical protein
MCRTSRRSSSKSRHRIHPSAEVDIPNKARFT